MDNLTLSDINSPIVSIIVPIYNVEAYLRQCIDSILSQSLRQIEVILIDDGSPDGCPALVDEYATKDSRIVAVHQPNGGYGKAVNHGISLACGKYIGIVEPDDFIEVDMYAELFSLAERNQADVAKGWFYDFLDTAQKRYTKPSTCLLSSVEGSFRVSDHPELIQMHPSIWSAIYRKDFLIEHNIKFTEAPGAGWTDNLFQVQTLCLAQRISFINKPLYHWRRVNEVAADDLKDYRIPFLRSDEIHDWLKKNNLYKHYILEQLYIRELAYILIVSRIKQIDNFSDCCQRIKNMIRRMDKAIVKSTPLNLKMRKAYMLCAISPAFFIFTRRLRRKLRRK